MHNYIDVFEVQITGTFSAARKALLSISGSLQDNPMADASSPTIPNSSGVGLHGNGMRPHMSPFPQQCYAPGHQSVDNGMNNRIYFEDEVVFKLLCQVDKVGNLIGKGGTIVRALQAETGASIKIAEAAASDSDEKVVVISAREACQLISISICLVLFIPFCFLLFACLMFL